MSRTLSESTIGNRDSYRLDADPATTYTPNEFNQYTSTANPAESFEYDEDGNLSEDGSRSYGWDAENRLVEVVPLAPANGDKKVRFRYDYMGRRVRKEVFTYAGGWPANPGEVQHFVYDNWNVVLVMNGLSSNQTVRKYTWGLDLSGISGTPAPAGIHRAGGIGGLLACQATFSAGSWSSFWYTYDANGNVVQVIDGTAAPTVMAAAAKYEYDPYGNTIAAVDLFLNNPPRFSTKWFDSETGLGYWGHRYYLPRFGRWISRDPIEEVAGLNTLTFCDNQPSDKGDSLGMFVWVSCTAWAPPATPGTWTRVPFSPTHPWVVITDWYVSSILCTRTCGCGFAWGSGFSWVETKPFIDTVFIRRTGATVMPPPAFPPRCAVPL